MRLKEFSIGKLKKLKPRTLKRLIRLKSNKLAEVITAIIGNYSSETKNVIRKTIVGFFLYRVIKIIFMFIVACVGLLIPIYTLFQLQEQTEVLQKQTNWLIEDHVKEIYQENLDRLYTDSKFTVQQRQLSLDYLIKLSLDFDYYRLSGLNLESLTLKNFNDTVTISNSQFSGSLFESYYLNDYDIYVSSFKDITIEFSEIRNVSIWDSNFSNSAFLAMNFVHSRLTGEIKNSRFIDVQFCGTKMYSDLENVYIKNTKFFCDDDFTWLTYSFVGRVIFILTMDDPVTNLGYAEFNGVVLENVDFSYANLEYVRNLDTVKHKNVCGNEETTWPEGVYFPNCDDL